MFNLPKVFSSGALFQYESELKLNGLTDSSVLVEGKIVDKDNNVISCEKAMSDSTGNFALKLQTPSPSFDRYRIELSNKNDKFIMDDILFGELWMATGQSNMEMANWTMPGKQKVYDTVRGQVFRTYHVDYYNNYGKDGFPYEPDNSVDGCWSEADDVEKLRLVSACATKFCADIYPVLNKDRCVPMGFLDVSWGGTGINQWFPLDEIDKDEYMRNRLEKVGAYPHREDWNKGDENRVRCQSTAMYNVKIAPVEGLKVRGILWYQGENDCPADMVYHIYADYLRFYHRVYREHFAADRDNFKMLCVMLYPWTYGQSGECCLGNLNKAFLDVSMEEPDKFGCIPISDLSPIWAFNFRYHPIHPANKYDVGSRLARLALSVAYNSPIQKTPAVLSSCEKQGNKFILKFDSVGSGLYIKGHRANAIYISDEKDRFFPADAKVVAPDTLEVKCDSVADPVAVAYGIQSMETGCNIFAGDFPIYPFYTGEEWPKRIESRPWYDTSVTSIWVNGIVEDNYQDVFYRPVWKPLPGSEICPDFAFCRQGEKASLRIIEDGEKTFGCFVPAYEYNRFDFQKYDGMTADFYNTEKMTAELVLKTGEDEEHIFEFKQTQDLDDGWFRYEVHFKELPDKEITRMIFRFRLEDDTPYRFVNMERLRLF